MPQPFGVDVFEGDGDSTGNIDWATAHNDGVQFCWVKVTEGDYVDHKATADRITAMRHAHIIPGAYVFLRPKAGRTGTQEARFALDHARKIGLYRADHQTVRDLRFCLDFEATAFPDTIRGRWQTRRYLGQAIDEIIRQLGRKPIIYTGAWFADPLGVKESTVRGCPLWVASYTAKPITPRAWARTGPAFWQFTDSRHVSGIGRCDANHYQLGNLSHLIRNFTI